MGLPIGTKEELHCQREEWMRRVCVEEGHYAENEGKQYCILHYPGPKDKNLFDKAVQKKLERLDFDFSGVWFSEPALFIRYKFSVRQVSFFKATFCEDLDFSHAEFGSPGPGNYCNAIFFNSTFKSRATFHESQFFGAAAFDEAVFTGLVKFTRAEFRSISSFKETLFLDNVDFKLAGFHGSANFERTRFNGELNFTVSDFPRYAVFTEAKFCDRARFGTTLVATQVVKAKEPPLFDLAGKIHEKSKLLLDRVVMDKPERVTFEGLYLRPHWFVNMDVRQVGFSDVIWETNSNYELSSVNALSGEPYRALSRTFRNLALNAEENHRYSEASRFRYSAMNLMRKAKWKGWALWSLDWWYWLLSGYGERVGLATFWILLLLVSFAFLYLNVGFVREPLVAFDYYGAPLTLDRAFTYSIAVMSLQKPDPRPLTSIAKGLVTFQSILGPLQATLLALAMRRKFARP